MSAICYCARPVVKEVKPGGEKYCEGCGHWWMPEHGSLLSGESKPVKSLVMDLPVAIRAPVKVGRNDSCPCHSGKKFKHCCGNPAAPAVASFEKDHPHEALFLQDEYRNGRSVRVHVCDDGRIA